jgi:hypothetical protein
VQTGGQQAGHPHVVLVLRISPSTPVAGWAEALRRKMEVAQAMDYGQLLQELEGMRARLDDTGRL